MRLSSAAPPGARSARRSADLRGRSRDGDQGGPGLGICSAADCACAARRAPNCAAVRPLKSPQAAGARLGPPISLNVAQQSPGSYRELARERVASKPLGAQFEAARSRPVTGSSLECAPVGRRKPAGIRLEARRAERGGAGRAERTDPNGGLCASVRGGHHFRLSRRQAGPHRPAIRRSSDRLGMFTVSWWRQLEQRVLWAGATSRDRRRRIGARGERTVRSKCQSYLVPCETNQGGLRIHGLPGGRS